MYAKPKPFRLMKSDSAVYADTNYDGRAINVEVGYSPYQAYWTKDMVPCDAPILLSYEDYNKDGVRLLGGLASNLTWMENYGVCCYGKNVHFTNYIVYKTEVSYNSDSNVLNKNIIVDLYYRK